MSQVKWAPAVFDWEPRAPRFVRSGPFSAFLRRYFQTHDDSTENVARLYVQRFGGSYDYRLRWLERALNGSAPPRLNLYLVDEVMTLLGYHPIEVYGDEWWDATTTR